MIVLMKGVALKAPAHTTCTSGPYVRWCEPAFTLSVCMFAWCDKQITTRIS